MKWIGFANWPEKNRGLKGIVARAPVEEGEAVRR